MIQKIIDKHLEKMAKEVLKTNDPMVLRFLKETKENGADEDTQLEAMVSILTDVICAREMDPEETLHEGIQSFLDIMEMHNESYDFTVTLKDDVIKSTRKITLPAYMMLSDLAYAVLCAFDGMGSHLFHLKYKKDIFGLIEDFDEMKDMGLEVYPPAANFLFFQSDIPLYDELLERNILVRSCDNFEGIMKGYYRIAVRKHEVNVVLLDAIREILSVLYVLLTFAVRYAMNT